MGGLFHPKDEFIGMWESLAQRHPSKMVAEIIGKSYENRDILMFKIGNPNGGIVLFDGCIHGFEDLGSEVFYLYAKWLLESGDVNALKILGGNYTLIVPIVNRDSGERQNRDFATCSYGVDLNRNFTAGWVANVCNSTDYHGTGLLSEPEAQALYNVMNSYRPKLYLSTHYAGAPTGCAYFATDTTKAQAIIARMNELSQAMGVTPYTFKNGGIGTLMSPGSARELGAIAWLVETADENGPIATGKAVGSCYNHTAHTLADIQNYFFPKMLPMLLAMSEPFTIAVAPTLWTWPFLTWLQNFLKQRQG